MGSVKDLSFYKDGHGNRGGFSLWSVNPSGDYSQDCRRGRELGREFIDWSRKNDAPFTLGHIVDEIQARPKMTGVEVGFFQEIAEAISR